ncbi:helix-turn-helix transcriptional regulator [Myroides sp. 1354]|uniref:AraC family transcriptional regulator n=1 Tax=unclassified Myroides TaxID=2642485 RepID=UPI002575CB57|nr:MULTISPECIES: AraC family transcriptional regulator [unclassified Myroides]MDM1046136.1 helix-turn-helix transcriptional regulator [Myroides sp. R163-1]MDM1057041.1 helix-turn-helix transcriptional regulator [Myroides sp. 1354]MDM1070267.1 helix-turn-helix transcriptional regulator [Myroides sp. 1372]
MELLKYILISIPMISSMTCGIILMVVFYKNLSVTEIPILRTLGGYYFALIALWITDNLTQKLLGSRIFLLPVLSLFITLSQVCFYQFISYIVPAKRKRNNLQYQIILVVFSLSYIFIYVLAKTDGIRQLDVQAFCNQYLRIYIILNTGVYTLLCWKRVYQYHQEKNKRKIKIKRLNWIHLLLTLKLAFTLFFSFNNYSVFVQGITVFILSFQHIILTFNMLLEKNRVKIPIAYKTNVLLSSGQIVSVDQTGTLTNDVLETTFVNPNIRTENLLTQNDIVNYFTKDKPYTKNDFRLDTLVTHFGVNRTYISKFINVTYNCNVSQFINCWRLKEVEQLQATRKEMNMDDLVIQAGFSDYRHYLRAVHSAEKRLKH